MRTFVSAAAAVALLSTPALSQEQYDGVDGFGHPIKAKLQFQQPPHDECAYQYALKRILDQNQKVDPWQTVQEKPQPK